MSLSLEYNTERGKLLISEYGRIIQKMIAVAVAETNREKRQSIANEVIKLMGQLNPHLRDVADYKHKLWDHLFVMSDFKLDVDSPYPIPSRETIKAKPEPMAYSQSRIKFRFYGKIVPQMIQKVAELEEGPYRTAYINAIGSFMKMSSKAWNLEMLNDDEVMAHLESLSNGKIAISESEDLQFKNMQQRKVTTIGEDKYSNNNNRNNNQNRNKFNKNRNFKNFKKRP
ncbi:MAG: DUF4290 domain-containing protein [Bacteroidia bacterium]|jgi:hypothetical protein|nr:DUF4290 domain-containing protein [Bacteroidia bacterium]MCF8447112.1 DUF4290 domain-containing protein [Bacteroidia bacterium]